MWDEVGGQLPAWRIAPDDKSGTTQFCQFEAGNTLHAIRHLSVMQDCTWTAGAMGRTTDLSWADLPSTINTAQDLADILSAVCQAQLCHGCSLEKYQALVDRQGQTFRGQDKQVVAEVDPPTVRERAIRSVCCMVLLPTTDTVANSRKNCPSCGLMDNTLRKAKSRLESRGDDNQPSKFSPYTSMTHAKLLSAVKASATELRKARLNVSRLRLGEAEIHGKAAL